MRFSGFVFLTISFSLILYMMGYGPIVPLFENGNGGQFLSSANNSVVATQCLNSTGGIGCDGNSGQSGGETSLTTILIGGLIIGSAAFVLLFANFSAIYIIPLIILGLILNFFILPWSFIIGTPFEIPGMVIFNIITFLAFINFVRGPT
jgi:hypothetical protein